MTIQKLTMTLSLILTIVGATWWCSQNLVFAAPYNSYKQEQAAGVSPTAAELWSIAKVQDVDNQIGVLRAKLK